MQKIEMLVQKDIAMKLQEAQLFHNLPINIHVKTIFHGMVPMTFEYDEEDELLAQWLTGSLLNKYTKDI